jgi:glycogen(starch) synthase
MKVTLLCIGPLRHDSRVLRHAELLSKTGYQVRILAQPPLPDHCEVEVDILPGAGSDWRLRAGLLLRHAPAQLWPASALPLYWASVTRQTAFRKLLGYAPDLIIANDWRALPIAEAVRRRIHCKVIYDSHEFASEEFSDSWRWRLLARRHVMWIEDRYIRSADAVIAVSGGLRDALATRYALPVKPTVIANMPPRKAGVFRATGEHVEVLYHGIIAPRRGLEVLIDSVAAWPNRFELRLRGSGPADYLEQLRGRARQVAKRVHFEDAAPPDQVVDAARMSDIGIFLLADSTIHARFALPNKLFEYLSAGLMVISSDLPEVRRIVDSTGCGSLLPALSEEAITAALQDLNRSEIDACKRRSLVAAETLNFDTEARRLLALVEQVVSHPAKADGLPTAT